MEDPRENLPNCMKCQHYYVTYRKDKPFGCRAMGFISRTNPARVVYTASGIHCQKFSARRK